jgi:hypothetical protein
MFKCFGDDNTDMMWLSEDEVKSITPVIDKQGKPYLMVNFYDLDTCVDSTRFFERVDVSKLED